MSQDSQDSAFLINHELRSRGLSGLDKAKELVPQLAMFVRDSTHLSSLLNACDPEERRHMYEALEPYLRFRPKPFHMYLIEMAADAERRQLPTIGPNGDLVAYKPPPEIRTSALADPAQPVSADDAFATAAVTRDTAKAHLVVVCAVCTREEVFSGITRETVTDALRAAGWRMAQTIDAEAVELCPACVEARAPKGFRARFKKVVLS